MRSLSIASTGMLAQQLNVEVISNNIANMNTLGYKRQRAEFQDLIYQSLERAGATTSADGAIDPAGVQIGYGVKAGSVYRIAEQGNLARTDSRYDMAINGRGYFQVAMPDGRTAYTRAGNFAVSATGQLVTEDGYVVQPETQIPENAIDVLVNSQGGIQALLPDNPQPQELGQLELATFVNAAGLEALGDNLFVETAASGPATTGAPGASGFGSIQQGFIESSNVNPVMEISALIQAQRAYEMNARVITTSDEMLTTTSQMR